MRNGYRIYHPSDDYLDFFSPHSTTMSFDPFKEYNDSKQIIDPSTPFFTLGSNPPLFDKLYYSPATSCKTDLTPYFLLLPSPHSQSSLRRRSYAIFAETNRAASLAGGFRNRQRRNQPGRSRLLEPPGQRRACGLSATQRRPHYRVPFERRGRSGLGRRRQGARSPHERGVSVCSHCAGDAVRPICSAGSVQAA